MKKFASCVAFIIFLGLITGCGNNENTRDLNTNLSTEIELSTEGASAVCTIDTDMNTNNRFVMGAKFVIFTEADIVTKVNVVEMAESNDSRTLREVRRELEERYERASQYGGYTYDIRLENNRLTISVTVDHTEVDFRQMANDDQSLLLHLNEDFRFTLQTIIQMYESIGVRCNRL